MYKWAYVLIFDNSVGTREEVQNFLSSRIEIINWYACLPNAIFITSNRTAHGLQQMMLELTGGQGRFLIVDVKTDKNGWLPKTAWDFLNNP